MHSITVGKWRTKASGAMQVASGPHGREKIHYEAPTYDRLHKEMSRFIKWFNASSQIDLVIKSAVAHFWFVTNKPNNLQQPMLKVVPLTSRPNML